MNGNPTDGPEIGSKFQHASIMENLARKKTKMEKTKYSRKIDSAGRILIPIRLREEIGLDTDTTCTFYKHIENGKLFLCIECPDFNMESELEKAQKLLEAAGRFGTIRPE